MRTQFDGSGLRTPERLAQELAVEVFMVTLDRLDVDEARELVGRLLDKQSADYLDIDAGAIVAEAAGHPLFIDALLRYRRSRDQASGPVRLDDALRARIERLPYPARNLLDVSALFGRPLALEVAAEALALPMDELDRQTQLLRAANLIRTGAGAGGRCIETYHDRVREAATSLLEPAARSNWHGRLALALEQSPAADPDLLAISWREAGHPERAARWFELAGDRAERALAFDHAAHLYQMALDSAPQPPLSLRIKRAEALANGGRGPEAAAAYVAAAAHAGGEQAIDLRRFAVDQYLRAGHVDQGLGLIGELSQLLGSRLPTSKQGLISSVLLQRSRLRLRGYSYQERSETEASADTLRRLDLFWSMAHSLALVDTLRSADFVGRGLLLALRTGEPRRLARLLAIESSLLAAPHGQMPARSLTLYEQARRIADQIGDPVSRAWVLGTRGATAVLLGRWREGADLLQQAVAEFATLPGMHWERVAQEMMMCGALYISWARLPLYPSTSTPW